MNALTSRPMKLTGVFCLGAVVFMATLIGCPPTKSSANIVDGNDGIVPKNGEAVCFEAICDLTAGAGGGSGEFRGQVIVSNDNDTLYVTFAPADGFAVGATHVDVLCTEPTERGAPGQYQSVMDPGEGNIIVYPSTVTHTFDLGQQSGSDECILGTCDSGLPQTVYVRAHANTYTDDGENAETGFGGFSDCEGAIPHGTGSGGGSWFGVIEYEVACCDDPDTDPDGCRTQTQGGWGAPAHGENPGSVRDYLYSEELCFPVVLGCAAGFELTLTDAAAMEAFLPTGGQPGVLDGDITDPTDKTSAGVLAGQLAAIKMTLCADENMPDFSPCDGEDAIAGKCYIDDSSPLNGLTVEQIVAVADEVIGGCSTEFSPGELNDALTNINENYTDGDVDLGFLGDC